ncbi:MAG: hypothetical protein LUC88_03585 [Prevotella sp.]|nr:hypothetical protein [Prevotella sp.]
MKKVVILLLTLLAVLPTIGQTKLDTLYYDKNWKNITTKAFATYYRVMEKTSDTTSSKPYRCYYFTGELQADGKYITIDKDDDSNSVFDGDYEFFYKSGKPSEKGSWKNGKHEGEFTTYNEDGLIIKHLYYSNGELDGICTEFNEDGTTCVQTEYSNGQPRYDYYVMSNSAGQCSKMSISDGKPIYENPSSSDMKIETINDLPWVFYDKNGINVGLNLSSWGMMLSIIITNNSMFPIHIDENDINVSFKNNKGEDKEIKVYSFAEYSKRLQQSNAVDNFFNALGESLAASKAGKSTSQTTSIYAGTTGLGSNYSGASTSVTSSYDATAAYQARITASNRIAAYGEALDAERKIKESGYFKSTTINPGETIVGYLYAKSNNSIRVKAGLFTIELNINGVTYSNIWKLWYVKQRIKLYPLTDDNT